MINEVFNVKGQMLCESADIKSKSPKKIIITGKVMSKNRISRNNVLYEWESVKAHCSELVGRPLLYNHLNEGNMKPVGHVTKSWIEGDTWRYEADVNPNSEYADSILRGDLRHVSIQLIAASAKPEKNDDGQSYTKAWVGDLLELSVVPTPGFIDADMSVALAEAFKTAILKEGVENGDFGNFPMDAFHNGLKTEIQKHQDIDHLEVAKIAINNLKENPEYYSKEEPEVKEEPQELDEGQAKDLWSRTREQDRVQVLRDILENAARQYVSVGWDQMPDFMKELIRTNLKKDLSYMSAESYGFAPDGSVIKNWQGNISWKYFNDEYDSLTDEQKKEVDERVAEIVTAFNEDVGTFNVPTGVKLDDEKKKTKTEIEKFVEILGKERVVEIYDEVFN